MIVVSDTSPINYLILVDEIDLLPRLFGEVLVPPAVINELSARKAPAIVKRWAADVPSWIRVRDVRVVDAALVRLGAGEREAISLAVELRADYVLIDELEGRRAAKARGLCVAGLLGILDQAADRGLIDMSSVLERLRQTTFRASSALLKSLRQREPSSYRSN